MRHKLLACSLLAAFLSASAAHAAPRSGDIPFSGTVASNCTVIVGSDGVLAANTDATVLGSKVSGGSAGTARVITNDNTFKVSVADPIGFTTKPSGFSGLPTFLSEFDLTGATTASGSSAASVALSRGVTEVGVDLTATLSAPNVFDQGNYAATVILTCG
jgi:type 1 fimbria pilin